jgi:hypothetical protein
LTLGVVKSHNQIGEAKSCYGARASQAEDRKFQ